MDIYRIADEWCKCFTSNMKTWDEINKPPLIGEIPISVDVNDDDLNRAADKKWLCLYYWRNRKQYAARQQKDCSKLTGFDNFIKLEGLQYTPVLPTVPVLHNQ